MWLRHVVLIVVFLAGSSAAQGIDGSRLVDLTYAFNQDTVYWPNAEGFRHRKDGWNVTPAGYWYAAGEFSSAEHGGTHVDSPIHFAQGKLTVDKIPVGRLVGPAVLIDVSAAASRNRDYRATGADVLAWEKAHGKIPSDAIVLFRTGWGRYWPDRKRYLGSDVPGDVDHLHFPGISKEAAELLVRRGVAGVGVDTASIDHGPSKDFIVHQILNQADIYGLENVANLERLPAKGATVIALPMKIENGSGAPARVIAVLPR
jgi:kynurenine formamidase